MCGGGGGVRASGGHFKGVDYRVQVGGGGGQNQEVKSHG